MKPATMRQRLREGAPTVVAHHKLEQPAARLRGLEG